MYVKESVPLDPEILRGVTELPALRTLVTKLNETPYFYQFPNSVFLKSDTRVWRQNQPMYNIVRVEQPSKRLKFDHNFVTNWSAWTQKAVFNINMGPDTVRSLLIIYETVTDK
jgi:hypothetical protein